MLRFAARPMPRLALISALLYCLVFAPPFSLTPVRAERSVPAGKINKTQSNSKARKQGEMLIKFRHGTPQQTKDQILGAFGKESKELRGRDKITKLKIKDGFDLDTQIGNVKQLSGAVEWAESNFLVSRSSVKLQAPPNDPLYSQQWALENTGQDGGAPGSDIGAPAGWPTTTGSDKTIIAVIDTGIDVNHPDLKENLWVNKREEKGKKNEDDEGDGYVDDVYGWNFVNDSGDVTDDHGHGTAMAGIIAAQGNNAQGMSGVMWKASVMTLKALDSTGSGAISDVVEAMDFAATHGASVINCSFGTDAYSFALLDSIQRVSSYGVLVVASAGNDGRDITSEPYYPAGYTAGNLISVAATGNGDQLATFSNWSPTLVQIAAPGVGVLTTAPGGQYVTATGTSASAPLVAGAAGLLKTLSGWMSAESVAKSLIKGARKSPHLYGKVATEGVVNLGESITIFQKIGEEEGPGGPGNPGGPGAPKSPNGPGKPVGPGGPSTPINLDYIRNNRPKPGEGRVRVNAAPESPYNDPEPGIGGLGGYYAQEGLKKNAVGEAGDQSGETPDPTAGRGTSINMGSQNVNFSAPILSLKGRAGLNLNLSLSYNSNLWVKNGSQIAFNTDKDVAGVGWNIGFGAIQGIPSGNTITHFYDSTSGKMAFFYIEPDGTRHTLAQVGASDIYLSYDSSHLKYNNTDKRLYMMGGTWLHFITPVSNGSVIGKRLLPEFIIDRNGNSITIVNSEIANSNMYDVDPNDAIPPVAMPNPSHDWGIDYIVDTWGRVIDFEYESNLLVRVNQLRSSGPYNYISIYYAPITISTHFSGVTADPTGVNGSQVWQPWYLEYPTKHSTRLFYTSYGQMYLAEKWVPDAQHQGGDRPVAFTRYDMPTVDHYSAPGGATMKPGDDSTVSDCPKFSYRWEWAENWVKESAEGNYFPAQGYVKTYPVAVYSYEFNAGSNFTVVRDAVGRVFRTDISSDGLTQTSKIYANEGAYAGGAGAALKTATAIYEKDAGLVYTSNLRPATLQISDGVSTKKSTYLYTNVGGANLLSQVNEYKDNGAAVYRSTETTYNTDQAYINQYILGLPSHTYVKTAGGTVVAHTQYFYDDADADHFDQAYYDDIPNHDNDNYNASFISGRGNLTRVMQYEIGGASRTTHTKYDRTGMVTSITNPDNAVTKFFYEEAHHAAPNRIVDAENKETGLWYYYYTGNIMQTHHLTSGTPENATFYGYDQFDRLVTVSRPDGGGIERMYWDNWMQVATFTKINTTSLEGFQIVSFDGAGRVWYEGGDHPDGAAGKFSVRTYEYDAVGRRYWSSNPTQVSAVLDEVAGHLTPTGDDAVSGYRWTNIEFDALDRVDLVIHPPYNSGGTLVNDTIDYDYSGCGCAGGSTITIRDERGKYRRTTSDSLGRLYESMELNASQGVYNRARYTYDERDLLQKIEHFDDGTTNFQTRSFTYDGYGRLASQTTPEAGTISYQYSLDDQVTRVTDARGMYADYFYNPRNLVTSVNYSEASTPDVTYSYGDYGERTMMRESLPSGTIGQTNYEYDPYKRLKKETRTFQDLPGKSYSVEYEYNFVDALKKIKYNMNGWQKEVNYSYNYTGAPTSIGTDLVSIGGLTTSNNILKDLNYRAFGAVKNVNYGNGRRMEATYDSNRMSMYQLVVKSQAGSGVIVNQVYDYHQGGANNGRIQRITDNWDGNYSATYTYDDYNRLSTVSSPSHSRSFSYDQWGNLTQTTASGNGETGSYGMNYFKVNPNPAPSTPPTPPNNAPTNRLDHQGYGYDDAGNMTSDGWGSYTYDGAGRLRTFGGWGNAWEYDGDGRKVKSISGGYPLYFVWSSVLNQPVAEVLNGGVFRAYVYDQGGRQIAQRSSDELFYWLHTDHLGSGRKVTDVSGNVVYRGEFDAHGQTLLETGSVWTITNKFTGYERNWATHIDYAKARGYNRYRNRFLSPDPLGIGAADPTNPQSLNRYSYVGNDPINNVDPSGLLACYIDGIESSCDMAFGMLGSGAGVIGPSDSTRWNSGLNGGKGGWEHFSVDAAGTASWKSWQAIPKVSVGYDDGGYEVLEWDHVFRTTRTLGQVMEWNGQLAFRYRGEGVLDLNGNLIGYRGIEMEMLGPLDSVGPGGLLKGSLRAVGPAAVAAGATARLTQGRLEHIVFRHWATSSARNASKFALGTTARDLKAMIQQTLSQGTVRANSYGRAGNIYEFTFGHTIGRTINGGATSSLRVVVGSDGIIKSAFPF